MISFNQSIQINQLFGLSSSYILVNNITQYSNIYFDKLLGNDLYTTFSGYIHYNGTSIKCVIKFFTYHSDNNNEFEILDYLQNNSTMLSFPQLMSSICKY